MSNLRQTSNLTIAASSAVPIMVILLVFAAPWCSRDPIVLAAVPHASNTPKFQIASLGTLGGTSGGTALNDQGTVVGWWQSGQRGFIWRGGQMRDLGSLPHADFTVPTAVNASGVVVGSCMVKQRGQLGFRWQNGVMVHIGALSRRPASSNVAEERVSAINDRGEAVGSSLDDDYAPRATLTDPSKPTALVSIPGSTSSQAFDIDASGRIVGSAVGAHRYFSAFLYSGGRIRHLGTLGGSFSHARAINKNGIIVGDSAINTAPERARAFLWRNGKMTSLGVLPEYEDSEAHDISDGADVVGWASRGLVNASRPRPPDLRAFLWRGGLMHDLNDLIPRNSGWVLEQAYGINNHGQIVGVGIHYGKKRAYLLTPVRTVASR